VDASKISLHGYFCTGGVRGRKEREREREREKKKKKKKKKIGPS